MAKIFSPLRSLRSRATKVSGREIKKPLNIFSLAETAEAAEKDKICL